MIEKVNLLEGELVLKDAMLMQDRKTIEDLNSQILTFNLVGLNQKYKKINIFWQPWFKQFDNFIINKK